MPVTTKEQSETAEDTLTMRSGLLAGTTVLTLKGEMKVEDLRAGDRIITRDTGMAVLKSVRTSVVTLAPIQIKAGSLGHNRPDTDMLTAPDTMIHVRDWRAQALFGKTPALVPARRLIDGEFISQGPQAQLTVYNLSFERQHIIYADGVEVATATV